MQLLNAHAKIVRANKHINDLKELIKALASSYVVAEEVDSQTGHRAITYALPEDQPLSKWLRDSALVLGDATHNLRSALDHAWYELIAAADPSLVNSSTKFLVRDTRAELESALRRTKIDVVAPALHNLILGKIKPYKGGDGAIWTLNQLNNWDKHRLLTPLLQYFSPSGIEIEHVDGRIEKPLVMATWQQQGPYYVGYGSIPASSRVKDKGKASLTVLFDDGVRGDVQHMDVPDILTYYSNAVLNAVQLLEQI